MQAVSGPTWTILIATLGQRREVFSRLLAHLMPQVDRMDGLVKVTAFWDNGLVSLAEKRQALLDSVRTQYVSFVDDDDMVSDHYVSSIMTALRAQPDYVGFWLDLRKNGRHIRMSHHSLRNGRWSTGSAAFLRDITHLNPMLTSAARTGSFRVAARADPEDRMWVDQVRRSGALKREVFIDKTMYYYMWTPRTSTWMDPHGRIKRVDQDGKPWEPLQVDSPNFEYHPDSGAQQSTAPQPELLIIVPTRSRPHNVQRMLRAWGETGAWGTANLRFDIDQDDPQYRNYLRIDLPEYARFATWNTWRSSMRKLNKAAMQEAGHYYALGFMGDDHCPETEGWAQAWVAALHELGTGFVYSADGIQDEKLPTQWAMTSDIVRAFGRMIPAKVDHLFCDNVILDLGTGADCIRYLGDYMIRHRHFINKMAPKDAQYAKVNSRVQWNHDETAYKVWKETRAEHDIGVVRSLR